MASRVPQGIIQEYLIDGNYIYENTGNNLGLYAFLMDEFVCSLDMSGSKKRHKGQCGIQMMINKLVNTGYLPRIMIL